MGRPNRITITGGFSIDLGKGMDGENVIPPQNYRDVEVVPERAVGGMTGAGSPPNIYTE